MFIGLTLVFTEADFIKKVRTIALNPGSSIGRIDSIEVVWWPRHTYYHLAVSFNDSTGKVYSTLGSGMFTDRIGDPITVSYYQDDPTIATTQKIDPTLKSDFVFLFLGFAVFVSGLSLFLNRIKHSLRKKRKLS